MQPVTAAVAIDLGGTKLAAAVIDESGAIQAARTTAVSKANARDTVEQVVREAADAVAASGLSWREIRGVGVIVPGIFRRETGTAWAPNLWGDRDAPLFEELAKRLPVRVHIDNDRAGCVVGERWLGVARDLSDVVFVSVGTGIGAGIVSGGRLVRGPGDLAGSVGWFALNPQFQEIYGQLGCWEAEAAGPAVARHAGATSAECVAAAARAGDPAALRAFGQASEYLAMGIANLISALNPQMVVLGGGLLQAADLVLEPIRRAVPRWAQPRALAQARIELTKLGDRAGLFGAAKLALSRGPEFD